MGIDSEIVSAISGVFDSGKAYDAQIKLIFSHRAMLAKLLQLADETFAKEFTFEELMQVLGETRRSHPNHDNSNYVTSMNLESNVHYGHDFRFDLLTTVPFSDEEYDLCTLNVEFQNKSNLEYSLYNRALIYFCRLVDDWVNTHPGAEAYKTLHKVTSIWIIKSNRDYIQHFKIKECLNNDKCPMDYLDIIFVYVSSNTSNLGCCSKLHAFLKVVLGKMSAASRVGLLNKFIPIDKNLFKEVESMCNLSEGIREEGRAEGREEAIVELVTRWYREGRSPNSIIELVGDSALVRDVLSTLEKNECAAKTGSVSKLNLGR